MEQKPKSTLPKEIPNLDVTNERKGFYLDFIGRYPIYSTLLVLDEYEKMELYEECSIIRDALMEYNETKIKNKVKEEIYFPTNVTQYHSRRFQKILEDYDIIVEEDLAQEKATLIKSKLPVRK